MSSKAACEAGSKTPSCWQIADLRYEHRPYRLHRHWSDNGLSTATEEAAKSSHCDSCPTVYAVLCSYELADVSHAVNLLKCRYFGASSAGSRKWSRHLHSFRGLVGDRLILTLFLYSLTSRTEIISLRKLRNLISNIQLYHGGSRDNYNREQLLSCVIQLN